MGPSSPPPRAQPAGDPDVFRYDHYADWVRDWMAWRTAERQQRGLPPYTRSMLARAAGLSDPGLANALSGKRRLTPAVAERIAGATGLDPVRARYFGLMAELVQCEQPARRARLRREMMALPGVFDARAAEIGALRSAASVVHLTVLELARHPDFRPDAAVVARLTGLDEAAASEALRDLGAAGLLDRSAARRDPALVAKETVAADLRYALQVDALDALDDALADDAPCCAVEGRCVPVRVDRVAEFIDGVRALYDELRSRWAERQSAPARPGHRVMLLGVQVFPATTPFALAPGGPR